MLGTIVRTPRTGPPGPRKPHTQDEFFLLRIGEIRGLEPRQPGVAAAPRPGP